MTNANVTLLLTAAGLLALLAGYAARRKRAAPLIMGAGVALLLAAVARHVIRAIG